MVFADNNVPFERKGRDHIIWLDLETTGSDTDKDYILEIGAIVTDRKLNELDAKQIVLPITQKMESGLVDVVRKMHEDNGLLAESLAMVLRDTESFIRLPEQVAYNNAVE